MKFFLLMIALLIGSKMARKTIRKLKGGSITVRTEVRLCNYNDGKDSYCVLDRDSATFNCPHSADWECVKCKPKSDANPCPEGCFALSTTHSHSCLSGGTSGVELCSIVHFMSLMKLENRDEEKEVYEKLKGKTRDELTTANKKTVPLNYQVRFIEAQKEFNKDCKKPEKKIIIKPEKVDPPSILGAPSKNVVSFVIDTSGSMKKPAIDDKTRISLVKDDLKSLVSNRKPTQSFMIYSNEDERILESSTSNSALNSHIEGLNAEYGKDFLLVKAITKVTELSSLEELKILTDGALSKKESMDELSSALVALKKKFPELKITLVLFILEKNLAATSNIILDAKSKVAQISQKFTENFQGVDIKEHLDGSKLGSK